MKGQWNKMWQAASLLLAASTLSIAQTNMPVRQADSVQPGAVNYVEGQVSLNGENLSSSSSLRSTVLQPNGVIDTGQGYAEVLLTPGAFLRIGNNSEVRMISSGLIDTKLAVVHGSAMIEAADIVKGSLIEVATGNASTQIESKGIYSFYTNNQSVRVLDGKAKVIAGPGSATLKKGDEVLLTSENPLKKHDFDVKRAQSDQLYVWSKVRSETESEINVNAATQVATYGGWYGPGWYWDPFWSSYAFLPGYGILGSPFGWSFYSPGFVYAAPFRGRGFYGRGYPGHYYAGRGFHGGMSGAHASGGFRGGMGGGGMHAGGGGGGHR